MTALNFDAGAGWEGTIDEFLSESPNVLTKNLSDFISFLNLPLSDSQTRAWHDSVRTIRRECGALTQKLPEASRWGIIFEYELPRERGRRTDIIILTGCSLQLIEFKGRKIAEQVDVDQLKAYARDLGEYHAGSRQLRINSILALDDAAVEAHVYGGVQLVGGQELSNCLIALADDPPCAPPVVRDWVKADYAPLPSLVAAARRIFNDEPLPQIRRASSAGIPQALTALQNAAFDARAKSERHIAFVTGVPGSGKTLVGLQFVYSTKLSDNAGDRPAVFLSGNGPLVAVLQDALQNRIFVQDVHGFLLRYGGLRKNRLPEEHIWVYDEAQRAWDSEQVKGKRGHDLSEPEDFLRLGMRMPQWSMLVGLIGEGQEIHLGEESGLRQWDDAIGSSGGDWIVHCPARVAGVFPQRNVQIDDALDLSTSLRSHVAGELHEWVALLLAGHLDAASHRASSFSESAFNLYITRDLHVATEYVRTRYRDDLNKRYGLLASSKAKNLQRFGIDPSFQTTRRFRPGPWYNSPKDSLQSSCSLQEVATEFACQGLELDFPIVGWDTDLLWVGDRWDSNITRSKAHDAHQLRINSYRVLLTRGRDGMIIFVPPLTDLNPTYHALLNAGCIDLINTITPD